jgi:hypothetical protein
MKILFACTGICSLETLLQKTVVNIHSENGTVVDFELVDE